MGKYVRTILIGLAVVGTFALPVWLADRESHRQAYAVTADTVRRYALQVRLRADRISIEMDRALTRLGQAGYPPCSAPSLALMREIDLGSRYLQSVGYIKNGNVVCSSMGSEAIRLGNDAYRTRIGNILYLNLPPAQHGQIPLVAVARGDYAVLIHRGLAIDALGDATNVSLAVMQPDLRRASSQLGYIDPAWLDRLGKSDQVTFTDGRHVVSLVRSRHVLTVAVAAMPVAQVESTALDIARRLVPAGAAVGLAFAAAILLLARRQMSMEAALRSALRRDEFFMCYQPIVELESGRWVGAEALVRWRRADGALVGPDLFIPVAEQSRLITRLTEKVLHLIAHDAGHFLAAHPHFHVALNLSAADLHSPDIVERLGGLLKSCGARPSNLVGEITERSFLNLRSAREVISALRGQGIEVAIDDFGTGYSSLSYLESLDLDTLKIDRSFIEAIGTGAPISQVVGHIIAMSHSMSLKMIAEGIESETQAGYLRERGVTYAQGFLFGRPMPFAELVQRYNEREHAVRWPADAVAGSR